MDLADRVKELSLQGYCCSQIIMLLGLEGLKKENPDMIEAMAGLCNGMHSGDVCGIITSACCLLALADRKKAASFMNEELLQWFSAEYGGALASIRCSDILRGREHDKFNICPLMCEETFQKILSIMHENGIDLECQ